jgi:rhodanese-related sulfurtransferase
MTPQETWDAFKAGTVALIDVRTPAEYSFEHVRGALLLPFSTFDPAHLPSRKDKDFVFYCGTSMRSGATARKCLAAGMDNVAHMAGGFDMWQDLQLPYIGIDHTTGAMVDKP